jgi:TolB-like protein
MPRALVLILILLSIACMVSPAARADGLQPVAKRLSQGLSQVKSKRIAVLAFPYHNGDYSSGSSIVSERLTTFMVERGGAQVVERALLDKTLGEMRLGLTGAIDPKTTQQLGKTLGAEAVVTGTLIDLEDSVTEVNARMVLTETGAILAAATTRIPRTWNDLPRPPVAKRGPAQEEERGTVHMSKLITVSSPRRDDAVPVYNGPMQSMPAEEAGRSGQEALSLTNDDLVPLNHRGQTDPERILNDFQADNGKGTPDDLHLAKRIYHRNPDPKVRGRALMAMGRLLERSGQPDQAAHAYKQVLNEFPDSPLLASEARNRLKHLPTPN